MISTRSGSAVARSVNRRAYETSSAMRRTVVGPPWESHPQNGPRSRAPRGGGGVLGASTPARCRPRPPRPANCALVYPAGRSAHDSRWVVERVLPERALVHRQGSMVHDAPRRAAQVRAFLVAPLTWTHRPARPRQAGARRSSGWASCRAPSGVLAEHLLPALGADVAARSRRGSRGGAGRSARAARSAGSGRHPPRSRGDCRG